MKSDYRDFIWNLETGNYNVNTSLKLKSLFLSHASDIKQLYGVSLMLNPELEMADNLCVKSVALAVLNQLFSILELHNVLFLRIYTTGLLIAAVNWSCLPCLKGNESKNPTQQSPTSPICELT